jgi:C1A family cysteine protease
MIEFGKGAPATSRSAFAANMARIRAHNADSTATWKAGVNKFTAMEPAQFVKRFASGHKREAAYGVKGAPHDGSKDVAVTDLPASLDWRTVSPSVVTPVKDQGGCGSCWVRAGGRPPVWPSEA